MDEAEVKLPPGVKFVRTLARAVSGSEQIKDTDFLGHVQNNGVQIALHGDVHEMRHDLIGHWHSKKLHVVGAGSFEPRAQDRPESTPRL